MRKLLPILSFLLCVALVAPASAQVSIFNQFSLFDFNFNGDGTRAKGMGGAFLSVANDGSALSWNPAGLIQVLDPQVSIEIDYFHPKSTYKTMYPNNPQRDLDNTISDNKVPMQFASFTAPVRIKDHQFVASASYSAVSTYYDGYIAKVGVPDVDSPFVFDDKYDSRLDMLRLGFGTGLYGELKFGAGIDIYFGKGWNDFTLTYMTHETAQGGGRVEYRFKSGIKDTISYSGVNFIGGFLWNKGPFAVGVVAKTPFWLTQKHVQHKADTLFENGLPVAQPGTINELPKERIRVPLDLGLGMSYKLTKDFLVSGDFEWRKFSSSKLRVHSDTVLSNGDVQELYTEYDLPMDDGYQLRFGAEYNINAGFAIIPVRAGYSYDTYGWREMNDIVYEYPGSEDNSIDSLFIQSTPGDQIKGYTVAFGTGFEWELIRLDFAFEYRSRDINSNGSDVYGDFNAVTEYRASRLSVNFTGFFK